MYRLGGVTAVRVTGWAACLAPAPSTQALGSGRKARCDTETEGPTEENRPLSSADGAYDGLGPNFFQGRRGDFVCGETECL